MKTLKITTDSKISIIDLNFDHKRICRVSENPETAGLFQNQSSHDRR